MARRGEHAAVEGSAFPGAAFSRIRTEVCSCHTERIWPQRAVGWVKGSPEWTVKSKSKLPQSGEGGKG